MIIQTGSTLPAVLPIGPPVIDGFAEVWQWTSAFAPWAIAALVALLMIRCLGNVFEWYAIAAFVTRTTVAGAREGWRQWRRGRRHRREVNRYARMPEARVKAMVGRLRHRAELQLRLAQILSHEAERIAARTNHFGRRVDRLRTRAAQRLERSGTLGAEAERIEALRTEAARQREINEQRKMPRKVSELVEGRVSVVS